MLYLILAPQQLPSAHIYIEERKEGRMNGMEAGEKQRSYQRI